MNKPVPNTVIERKKVYDAKQNVLEHLGAEVVLRKGQVKHFTLSYPDESRANLAEEERIIYEWLMNQLVTNYKQ